jgi:hypothetical protein
MKAIESIRPTIKSIESLRPMLNTAAGVLALPTLLPRARAFARPSTARRFRSITSRPGGMVGVAAVAGALTALGLAITLYDMKRKRNAEAADLRAKVSDALLGEPTLAGLPITPSVRVPLWRGPVTIEITGPVPTAEFRDAVLQIVRGMPHNRWEIRVEDRITVDPSEFDQGRLTALPG